MVSMQRVQVSAHHAPINFNLFINQKDRSATHLHWQTWNTCRDTLKYTCISNTKHNVNTQHIQLN